MTDAFYAFGSAALGTVLASRTMCWLSRIAGAALIAVAVFVFAAPAFAASDQTLMVADGAQVSCVASGALSGKVDVWKPWWSLDAAEAIATSPGRLDYRQRTMRARVRRGGGYNGSF